MFISFLILLLSETISTGTVISKRFCILEEETNYKLIYCDLELNQCCDKGCCKSPPKIDNTKFGGNPSFPTYVWLVMALGIIVYLMLYICHILKKRTDDVITPPQTPEINLTLNFNQPGGNNFNMHLPAIPLTPRTPPPAYMTLTPPPTYSAAILFPPIATSTSDETK